MSRNAALDNDFSTDPTTKGIIYSDDDQESKYNKNSNEGNKDKDREDNGDEDGGDDEDKDKDREDDKDEDNDAEDANYYDDNFYKSLLFDDNDDNSIGNAKYCVPLARGAGAGRKLKSGHPDKPNTDGMSEQEAEEVLSKWEKDWKKARDKDRRKSAHEDEFDDTITYTGVLSNLLRTMTEVKKVKASPFKVGDTFLTKDRLLLRIVEEANLYGVQTAIKRSDTFQVDARGLNGDTFHIQGNLGKNTGWKVTVCVVGIESISCPATPNATAAEKRTSPAADNNRVDSFLEIRGQESNLNNTARARDDTDDNGIGNKKKERIKRQKSPMKSKYLVPLMTAALTERPNIFNKEMTTILKPYINDVFITNALLQKTCSDIYTLVFGDPSENVQLLGLLAVRMEALGHYFEVMTKTQMEVTQKLVEIVLSECVKKAKKGGNKMKREEKIKFVKEWKEKNFEMLLDKGLIEETTLHKFVGRIYMAASTGKQNVPMLQTIYQSDAAHMNFGKYTLYSCYGITAYCNASPVTFSIVFGNEDKSGWVDWTFTMKMHPCLNAPEITIITNREKGFIEAIAEVLPLAVNFFCSFHQKKNIETFVKGGK